MGELNNYSKYIDRYTGIYIYIESGNKNKNHSSIHLRTGKQPTWNNDLRGDEEKCKR